MAGTAGGTTIDQNRLKDVIANKQAQYDNLVGQRFQNEVLPATNSLYDAYTLFSNRNVNGVDDVRRFVDEMKQDSRAADWEQGRNLGDYGQSYNNLVDWLKTYDSLNPTRTVKQR